jgi:hypothetical protein
MNSHVFFVYIHDHIYSVKVDDGNEIYAVSWGSRVFC